MANRIPLTTNCTLLAVITAAPVAHSQGVLPYPHAITDRLIHSETPMPPAAKNVLFNDRDFGSLMVRVTDPSTNFKLPGTLRMACGLTKRDALYAGFRSDCAGDNVQGFNSIVNGPAVLDDMQIVKRPLSDISAFSELYYPLPSLGPAAAFYVE